jgi:hypothetical protein
LLARHGEVATHDPGPRVVLAEDPPAVGEGLLVQGDGPAQVPRPLVGSGEVGAAGQGVGMVLAQDPREIGAGPLNQGNGPGQVPRGEVGGGEVVPGATTRSNK